MSSDSAFQIDKPHRHNWTFRFFTPKIAPKAVLERDIPKKTKNS